MRWFQRCLPLLLSSALLLHGTPAGALQITDPDDVSGKLDLMTLSGTKADATAPMRIKIQTYENWTAGLLKRSGHDRVFVLFNTDSDPAREFRGVIKSIGGKLWLRISGEGSSFEPLRVRHPDGHTLRMTIPGTAPMNPKGTVRIAARSRLVDSGGCTGPCVDRAPNAGWMIVAPTP